MGEVGIMEEVYQASYKWNFSVENGRTLMISWRFQTWGSGRMMLLQAEKESSSHHLLRCIVQADYMRNHGAVPEDKISTNTDISNCQKYRALKC